MLRLLIVILICSVSLNSAQVLKTCEDEEKENYVCKIDKNYNNALVPQEGNKPLVLDSNLEIFDITNVDENGQTLTVLMKVTFSWKDDRLAISAGDGTTKAGK